MRRCSYLSFVRDTGVASPRIERLTERLASLRSRLGELEEIGRQLETAADGQLSLTDPDARAMATGSDYRGVVGYNLQAAVDTKHHIVAANAVTNQGLDRSHLREMAEAAKATTGAPEMIALTDRGYFEGEQIRACAEAGIVPWCPSPTRRGRPWQLGRAGFHLSARHRHLSLPCRPAAPEPLRPRGSR